MKNLFSQVPRDRIVNCDETSLQLFPNGILTWADTGSDSIQTAVNGNVKDSITIMGTITAAGTKLPLHIIAKGNAERVEASHLGDISYRKSTHSTTVCRKSRVFRKLHSQNFSVRSWNIKSFFFDTESESAEQRKFK